MQIILFLLLTMIAGYIQPGYIGCMDDLCIEDICNDTACVCAKCQLTFDLTSCTSLKSAHLNCLPERLTPIDKIVDYATCPIDIDHPPRVV